jgi:type II pantothenate kinase
MATGGGAYKFYNRMKEILHVDVIREDEMECLIIGENCLLSLGFSCVDARE